MSEYFYSLESLLYKACIRLPPDVILLVEGAIKNMRDEENA